MKIGIAAYGLDVWRGGRFSSELTYRELKSIGYDGIENLSAANPDELIGAALELRRMGMDFATVSAPKIETSIKWCCAMGKRYVWTNVAGTNDLDLFCRYVNEQIRATDEYGIKTALHNHLGSVVETQEQLDRFMEKCPGAYLILDTAHLAGAGGDVIGTINRYHDRIISYHAKDFVYTDKSQSDWYKRLRFCGLGRGEMGELNADAVKLLTGYGYDEWILVEHDTHLREPMLDYADSREFLRSHAGI